MGEQAKKCTLGVIVGNRGFFPGHLCESGRQMMIKVLEEEGIDVVILDVNATRYGAVESLDDANICSNYFKEHRNVIDGMLVTLPNFGDERAVANVIRVSALNVPVLIHAFNDEVNSMTNKDRRDSFCGKISVCNNLKQYGITYSLTSMHTVDPKSESFRSDLNQFAAVCRVVKSLRSVRLGAIGARPAAFNTVRYSEKLLERQGISIETLDLSEVFGRANRLKDQDRNVQTKLEEMKSYVNTNGFPEDKLLKMARLGVTIEQWMKDYDLSATAIQCWTSMEEFFGIAPCTIMSMMSNSLLPSACEVDIPGLVGMYALQQASGRPSALLDWNNNYGDDPDKGVVFHCSNLPKDVFEELKMDYHEILAGAVGRENTYGTLSGRIKSSPFTYCRVSTDDFTGEIRTYVGEGSFTKDPLLTFGGYGVVQIPQFQKLLTYICEQGFEHHIAANLSSIAPAISEAFSKYLNWNVYHHQ
ncbi:L-fucose/L-arabinose isomerase family protein [Paenibacillus eucommiae]|uniref:L-fucose isomerase-like protein n=1 Tax=Paenibacillus eucommiae TaxID=1355755 RepID=A0ABS4ITC6_9BACL|nr:L-fucose/L-arabinose isomerase family protein [Paenibacillus eucommiae]MBP1990815.1 L-fucose isomerase-like protein [Paenibacillus eucommiae]